MRDLGFGTSGSAAQEFLKLERGAFIIRVSVQVQLGLRVEHCVAP